MSLVQPNTAEETVPDPIHASEDPMGCLDLHPVSDKESQPTAPSPSGGPGLQRWPSRGP